MNVYPKCLISRAPQITYHGYVLPCCWMSYYDELHFKNSDGITEIKKNPFLREDFNLYNNKLEDILDSTEWKDMLHGIIDDTPLICSRQCGKFLVDNGKVDMQNISVPRFDPYKTNKEDRMSSITSDESIFWDSVKQQGGKLPTIQLESTSRCSLKCPYCSRTRERGQGTYYKDDLSPEVMQDIINYSSGKMIDDCGRYGDPVYYKYFHEMLDMIKDSSIRKYQMHNSATGRTAKWWEDTIKKMVSIKNNGIEVKNIFGIDGLKDTSHIHRVNQDWDEVTRALLMSKEAGIETVWQFIPMRQNEHQIDKVKRLAKKWGVHLTFAISNRFNGPDDPMIPLDPNLHAYKK